MLNFTVKNLINACQNTINSIIIYREDTKIIFDGEYMADIDAGTLESEVQNFYISSRIIFIYI